MDSNVTEIKRNPVCEEQLENFCKDWKIFIDACSLLEPSIETFFLHIIPYLEMYNNKIYVPYRVIEEIQKHSRKRKDTELAGKAKKSLKIISKLIEGGYIDVRGEATDNFADNVFQTVFTKFRMNYKLLLITQDNDLAKDIMSLNSVKSQKAYPVQVKKINKFGYIGNFRWNMNDETNDNKNTKPKSLSENEVFRICKDVTQIDATKIKISYIPGEGDYVKTPIEKILLKKELGAGGEATVYETNSEYIAKIYKKEVITERKHKKIELMLTKKISCEGVCFPVDILYNDKDEFVGYLMPRAKGQELQKSVFGPKPLFIKKFPGWKKRDTVELCVTILKKIKYLHDRNIIMGDINPANILVVNPNEVYFVDTDSYQVEDFPCPVGTINYTAPEIQKKHFTDFLRTIGNENFAVATLLFMIMLPGKPPYSQQGGEDPITNIIKMDFSYPFGDNSNKKTPDGPWRYIWSHLTYDLKEAFYCTFRKGEKYSTEDKRLPVSEWLHLFEEYLNLLDSGKFRQQDEMSEELFPTRHKKNPKATYIRCKLCNQEADENRCKQGICRSCLEKGEIYSCKKCGKDMIFTNYDKYIKKGKKFDMCRDCFEEGNEVYTRITCSDCGKRFDITNREYDFFRKKGFELPKRCESCRDARKNGNYLYDNYHSSSRLKTNNTLHTEVSGSPCFITTAVCEYYGKNDDCYELTTLRHYRDNWLNEQNDGKKLIREYYNCAPLIVQRLKESVWYDFYCETLMNKFINPCLEYINEGQMEKCKMKYIDMVNYAMEIL